MSIRWPCYHTVHVYVAFIFVIVCDLFEWKQPCAGFYCLFIHVVYVLPLEIQLSRAGIPLTGLTLPHVCACPKKGPGFQTSYVVVFFCIQWVQLRWEWLFVLREREYILIQLWTSSIFSPLLSYSKLSSLITIYLIGALWLYFLSVFIMWCQTHVLQYYMYKIDSPVGFSLVDR
jgi:hypothetical protein